MRNGIMRRILAFILVCTMLAGQVMVNVAYATGSDEIPVVTDGENNSIDFTGNTGEESNSSEGEADASGNGNGEEAVLPSESGSEDQKENSSENSDGETGNGTQGSGEIPIMGEGDSAGETDDSESEDTTDTDQYGIMALGEDDGETSEVKNGGISVTITTNPPSGTLKDGDKFSFTVVVEDKDLVLEPNIKGGDQMTIQLPEFLEPEDAQNWLNNLYEYFEEDTTKTFYDPVTHSLTLTFKDVKDTTLNMSLKFSMIVNTIGYNGDGSGTISVDIGDTVKTETPVNVDNGTGTGTGEGTQEPGTVTSLDKRIWSNSKNSSGGGGLIIRDPKEPIGYSIGFNLNLNGKQTAVLKDDLSGGDLILCDSSGNVQAPTFSLTVGNQSYSGTFSDSSVVFGDTPVGTVTIAKSDDGGFTLTCDNASENPTGPVNVSIRYFAKASTDVNFYNNSVDLSIASVNKGHDSVAIRKYDNSVLRASKSIYANGVEIGSIDLDEDGTFQVTFCITLTQYGVGDVLKQNDEVTYDILEECFAFLSNSVQIDSNYFALSQDGQTIRIIKANDDAIQSGVYKIYFTVAVNPNKLDYGKTASNTVGNTVTIRRKAKLTIDKTWLKKADGTNADIGDGARFVLYKDEEPIADSGVRSNQTSYTLYIPASVLEEGTYTYTLKEEVDPDNGYQAAAPISIVIKRAEDDTITFVKIGDRDGNKTGSETVNVENQPDSGKGVLIFKKYADEEGEGNLLDGGQYELYRVYDDDTEELVRTFSTVNGVYETDPLDYGTYYVKEISAPAGYLIGRSTTEQVVLSKSSAYVTVSLVNERFQSGEIRILKWDATNKHVLEGVEFAIEGTDKTAVTGSNGYAIFSGLSAGEYYIRESKSLPGYSGFSGSVKVIIDENGQTDVEVTAGNGVTVSGKTVIITWNNVQQFGSIKINKKGPNNGALAGAEFALYDSQGTEVRKGTTGDNGVLEFTGLAYGDYILRETAAPTGYVISENLARGVEVAIHSTATVELNYINDTQKGSIVIHKVEKINEENIPLSGAVFGLYSDETAQNLITTKTTGTDGTCTFTNLEAGTYYVKEISAPTGYQVSTSVLQFDLGPGENQAWSYDGTVENSKRLYHLDLRKTNEDGTQTLAGAQFKLEGTDLRGNAVTLFSTESGADGICRFTGLPFGTYTITEIQAPDGYAMAKSFTVEIKGENTPADYTENQVVVYGNVADTHTRLTVLKVDDENGDKGLPGTKFKIRLSDDQYVTARESGGSYIYTGLDGVGTEFVTGQNGTFVLEYLPLGSYTLVETGAPDGYIISQEETDFKISEADQSVTVGNTQIKAKLSLVKTDGYGKLLPGVGFTLRTGNGYVKVTGGNGAYTFAGYTEEVSQDATVYTGADGRLSVDGLLWGIYTLDEAAETTPEGLIPVTGIVFEVVADQSSKTMKQSVAHGGTLELPVTNPCVVGTISFKKVESDRVTGLSGAVFKLELAEGNDYSEHTVRYAVSDSSGLVTFENVPYGKYTVTEYLAPYGKTLSTEVRTVAIDGTRQVYELDDWVNEDQQIRVVFKKAGTDGTALTGAIFQILDENQKVVVENLSINSTAGEKVSLPVGVYYLQETKAPENYVLNSEPLQFRVTEDGNRQPIEVVMKNEPVTGSLTLVKKDADTGNCLAGAEFKVYKKDDYDLYGESAEAVYTASTNSDGTLTIRNIPFGQYTVVETAAPAGYELNTKPQNFTITETGETVPKEVILEFTNEKSRYVLEISKVDIESGEPLTGATFAVYATNFYTEVSIDESGKVSVEVPAAGTYFVAEIAAPDGYTLDPNVYQVEVDGHTPVGAEVKAQFVSKDYPTKVHLQKVDENGEPLDGAVFQVYRVIGSKLELVFFERNEDGAYRYSPGSDLTEITAGSAQIECLPVGSYVLRETESPSGYMNLGDISFTVSEEIYDQVISITAQNLPYKRGVAVCKENEQGIRLAGAQFTLYDESGAEPVVVSTVTTGASGYAVFSDLESGSYSIRETAAPEGYQKIDTKYSFRIDGDGVLQSDCVFVTYGSEETPFYVLTLTNVPVEHAFQLKKVSASSGTVLEGAKFRILGSGINAVYSTGEDGLTERISLPVGEYTLTEIQAPDGYIIDATGHHLAVKADGVEWDGAMLSDAAPVITFENEPQSFHFAIVKQDDTSRQPLAGAAFTVTGEDGSKSTLVTDEKGQTGEVSLNPGRYAVTEVIAPEGYNVPLAGWSFTVEEGTQKVMDVTGGADYTYADGVLTLTLTNERTTGSLLIYKHSASDDSEALAGAQFQIRDADNELVWFTLKNGVYHAASSDASGAGNVLTTNAMGQALLDGLRFGEYTVYEVTAPAGYALRAQSIQVKLTRQDETLKVDVANEQLTRKVTVFKQSAGENPEYLIGAVFTLYRISEDGTPIYISEATTGYDGKAEFTVPYGEYTIVETRAPAGYELSHTDPWIFSYHADTPEDYEFTYTFVNEKTVYDLEIYKYDADQKEKGLAGAEFAVTNSRGYTITIKTDADGMARLDNIDYDDYTIREVTAPEGYYLNDQVYSVTRDQLVHGAAVRIEVPDTRILGSVLLRKVDFEDHDQILEAEFTVSDSDGQLLSWQKTEEGYVLSEDGETIIHAGEVILSGLPAGEYSIDEVEAPKGYLILDESRSFTVNAENAVNVIEIEIENLLRKVAVGIIKMDAADKTIRLSGAEFTLYPVVNGVLGSALTTAVTNENGLAVFADLAMGSYRIVETKAPYGFKLWTNSIDFVVDADGRVLIGKNQTEAPEVDQIHMFGVLNTSILKDLKIKKVSSEDGKALSGATFAITGNGKTWRVTTGEDGDAVFSLPYGEYVLREVIAPNGYVLDESRHLIEVTADGITIDGSALQELTYVFKNTPVTYALSLHKQDDTNARPLSGAEFQISGDGVSYTLKTNASGNTDTVYLKPGQYTLTETKAPNGYQTPLTGWKLTVSEQGHVSIEGEKSSVAVSPAGATVTVENGKKPSGNGSGGGSGIAKTGQISNNTLLLSGAMLMLVSFTGLLILVVDEYKRRRKPTML